MDIIAAIIREKGSNSEREMAYMMDLCGFDVVDVHMTDLIEGREKLDEILERQNRRKLVQACIEFLPTRVELDLRGWNNDIFSHSS